MYSSLVGIIHLIILAVYLYFAWKSYQWIKMPKRGSKSGEIFHALTWPARLHRVIHL